MTNNLETLLYEAIEKPPIKDKGNNQYLYLELQRLQEVTKSIIELYGYCEGVEDIIRVISAKQDSIFKNLPIN